MYEENPKLIRIQIKWTDKLLSLGACAGDLIVSRLRPTAGHEFEILMTGRVKVERHSYGYEGMEWADDLTFENFEEFIKPSIDVMMRSYHDGMLLENQSYTWIKNWKVKNE